MNTANKDFPPELDDKGLEKWTQEQMRGAVEGVERDKIENVVFGMRAQLGMSEIHKRQNDKANKHTFIVAITAIIITIISIAIQVYEGEKLIRIERQELTDIKSHLENIQNVNKGDSILFYLKRNSMNNVTDSVLFYLRKISKDDPKPSGKKQKKQGAPGTN